MARVAPRPSVNSQVDVFEDGGSRLDLRPPSTPTAVHKNRVVVLGEIDVNGSNSPFTPKLDSLAVNLEKLHIKDSPKRSPLPSARGRRVRPPIDTGTLDPLKSVEGELRLSPTEASTRQAPSAGPQPSGPQPLLAAPGTQTQFASLGPQFQATPS